MIKLESKLSGSIYILSDKRYNCCNAAGIAWQFIQVIIALNDIFTRNYMAIV